MSSSEQDIRTCVQYCFDRVAFTCSAPLLLVCLYPFPNDKRFISLFPRVTECWLSHRATFQHSPLSLERHRKELDRNSLERQVFRGSSTQETGFQDYCLVPSPDCQD